MNNEGVSPLLPPKPLGLLNSDSSGWMDAQNSLKSLRRSAELAGCGAQPLEQSEPKQGDYYRPKPGTGYHHPGAGYTFLRKVSDIEWVFRADHSGEVVTIPFEHVERVRL